MNSEQNKFLVQGKFKEITGSILAPQHAGLRLVLSTNNLSGKPENPVFPIFDKKWRKVREDSKGWFSSRINYKLGCVNTTAVQSDTWVIHLLCQDENFKTDDKALEDCLKKVTEMAKYEKASVHVSQLLLDSVPGMKASLLKLAVENGVNVYSYKEE